MIMKSRLLKTVRQIGWYNGGWYALAMLIGTLSRGRWGLYKYRLVAQAVAREPLCRGRGGTIEVRALDAGACAAAFSALQRRAEVIAARYHQGAQCLAAYRAGELLGFLWFTAGPYQEDEVRARFVNRQQDVANRYRKSLEDYYGKDRAAKVQYAEAFEICEYGRRPDKAEIKRLFPFYD